MALSIFTSCSPTEHYYFDYTSEQETKEVNTTFNVFDIKHTTNIPSDVLNSKSDKCIITVVASNEDIVSLSDDLDITTLKEGTTRIDVYICYENKVATDNFTLVIVEKENENPTPSKEDETPIPPKEDENPIPPKEDEDKEDPSQPQPVNPPEVKPELSYIIEEPTIFEDEESDEGEILVFYDLKITKVGSSLCYAEVDYKIESNSDEIIEISYTATSCTITACSLEPITIQLINLNNLEDTKTIILKVDL